MTNYMDAPLRPGSPSEETPSAISRSAIVDEVRIARRTPGDLCFDVILRTHVALDTPLSEWNVKINGAKAYFGEEAINVRDYFYTGERDVFVAQGATANAFASMRLTEPTENVYRVVERSARVCSAEASGTKLSLELELPMDDLKGSWGEVYEWTIR